MVGRTNRVLYTLNTTTGAATRVGSASTFGVGGLSVVGALASNGSNLYMTGGIIQADTLYTLNVTTGVATSLGFTDPAGHISGMAFYGSTLYGASTKTNKLYTINSRNAVETVVNDDITSYGIVLSGITMEAMTEHDGVMYAADERTLYRLADSTPGTLTIQSNPTRQFNARPTATVTDAKGIQSITENRSVWLASFTNQGSLTFRRTDANT